VNQKGRDGAYCYTEARVNILGSGNRNSSLNFQEELVLFPNPARDQLFLTMSDLEGKVNIKIYNTLGHLEKDIPEIKANAESIAIDLNGFENGMYWLSCSIANKPPINKRFIVEHLR